MSFEERIEELNVAVRKNNVKKARKILLKDPNLLKDSEKIVELDREDPLDTALKENASVECIKLLLENGLKLKVSGGIWESYAPLIPALCTCGNRKKVLQLLLESADTLDRVNYSDLLNFFFSERNLQSDDDVAEIVEILLDAGLPINEPGGWGYYSPLERSIEMGNAKLSSLLISRGAVVRGSEALQVAAINNKVNAVDFLLSNGADINDRGRYGFTALYQACAFKNEQMIGLLLKRGANINVETDDGETPFSELVPSFFRRDDKSRVNCVVVMVKEFSRLMFENHFVSANNINLIQEIPEAQEHFDKCKSELWEMASTVFYAPYTFYSIFNMSIKMKKLAKLTKNEELVEKFETNLPRFFYFKSELQRNWEDAVNRKNEGEAVFSRLSSVFYDYLPEIVINILADNLTLNDLPLE